MGHDAHEHAHERPLIYIAVPTYKGEMFADLMVPLLTDVPLHRCHLGTLASSLLTRGFNTMWCDALNLGADYFLMVHADVVPAAPGWMETLLGEMRATGADALGAIIPIKDENGLTSTALTHKGNTNQRRLTVRESLRLPETFGATELAAFFGEDPDGAQLLLNTGLLLVDLKKHRVQIEQIYFRMRDTVQKGLDGKFFTWTWSEDWHWSRDAAELGLNLRATRKVKVTHKGQHDYCNCCAWGTMERDPQAGFIAETEEQYIHGD